MNLLLKDIDKQYTSIVSKYLSQGYVVNIKSMNGSQGDWCKIDLRNETNLIRIRLCQTTQYDFKEECKQKIYQCLKLVIEEFSIEGDPLLFNRETIWNNNGTIIETILFYCIDTYKYVYTMDRDYAIACIDLCQKRNQLRRGNEGKELKFNVNKIYEIVTNKKGYKSIHKSDILSVVKYTGYFKIIIQNRNPIIMRLN